MPRRYSDSDSESTLSDGSSGSEMRSPRPAYGGGRDRKASPAYGGARRRDSSPVYGGARSRNSSPAYGGAPYGGVSNRRPSTRSPKGNRSEALAASSARLKAVMADVKPKYAAAKSAWEANKSGPKPKITDFVKEYYAQNPGKGPRRPHRSNVDVHGLTTSALHQPVTKSQAVKLFLEHYAEQAKEGRLKGRSGIGASSRGAKLANPAQALKSRLSRNSEKYNASTGRWDIKKPILEACPDNVFSRADAKKAGCDGSWQLRKRSGFRTYQVPDVTLFKSDKEARASPLYKASKTALKSPKRAQPSGFRGSPRFKTNFTPAERTAYEQQLSAWRQTRGHAELPGQTRDAYRVRMNKERSDEGKAKRRTENPLNPGQTDDQWRQRRRREARGRSPSRSPVASQRSQSPTSDASTSTESEQDDESDGK